MAKRRMALVWSEIGGADLGDLRRSARLGRVAQALVERPGVSLPRAMGSEAETEGAYRLLRNEEVDAAAILAPHIAATAERVVAEPLVYCVSDTTEFRFGGEGREGLGALQGGGQGFLAHVALAVSADGSRLPLGIMSFESIVRSSTAKGRRGTKASRKAPDSESRKWARGVAAAEAAIAGRAKMIHLMDREADIYDLLATMSLAEQRFVVRAGQNRLVGEEEETTRLFEELCFSDEVVVRQVPLSRRLHATRSHARRTERRATLSFAAKTLTVRRPASADKSLPPTVLLNFVHVFERSPPEGETAIDWKLITTEPVDTVGRIEAIVDAYRVRWVIEEYFKAIKTGCAIEKSQLETLRSLLNLLAIQLPIAVQLLALRSLAESDEKALALRVLTPLQLEVLRKMSRLPLPSNPTAQQALLAIAALGGHLKNNGAPGWQVLARGFDDLLRYVEAWTVLKAAQEM